MKYKNLAKRKAIIADDEEVNPELFTFVLEQDGWEVKQAKDGQEALEKVLQWRPSLLILDYLMPKLTGAEVYQQLQLHNLKLAVVLNSSHDDLEKLAASLGINYYLYKPCDMTKFLITINSAYEKLLE